MRGRRSAGSDLGFEFFDTTAFNPQIAQIAQTRETCSGLICVICEICGFICSQFLAQDAGLVGCWKLD